MGRSLILSPAQAPTSDRTYAGPLRGLSLQPPGQSLQVMQHTGNILSSETLILNTWSNLPVDLSLSMLLNKTGKTSSSSLPFTKHSGDVGLFAAAKLASQLLGVSIAGTVQHTLQHWLRLSAIRPIAAAITRHPMWLTPYPTSGRTLMYRSLLGPLFCLNVVSDAMMDPFAKDPQPSVSFAFHLPSMLC